MKPILIPIICAALMPSVAHGSDYLNRSGWSWSTSSECAQEDDIAGLKGIYDGNTSTCWHSNFHAANGTAERSNPHWVMIDRGTDTSLAYGLSYLPRQNSDNPGTACTEYAIYFADRSLGSTSASSWDAIVAELGQPDIKGTWVGDSSEKIVMFDKPNTAKYILFVNIKSNGSNSAACAEMNLISKAGGSGLNPGGSPYNAIRIVTPDGDSHRIAIDGQQLAFSIADRNIRLGNSSITVEYSMDEVKYFQPDNYEFATDELYNGPKRDIYELPVEISLDPANLTIEEGQTAELTATLANAPEDAQVVWGTSDKTVAKVNSKGTVTAVAPGTAKITARYEDVTAECHVTVTAKPVDGIAAAQESTVTLKLEGETLIIGGIGSGSEAVLHSLDGVRLRSGVASASGVAKISVAGLTRTAYLLSVSGLTLKIII